MNTTPLTPGQRHEAWSRLRTMTTGVAMAGIAATAGIGAVTALHHHGKTASASSVATNASAGAGASVAPDAGEPGATPDLSLPALGAPATAAPGKVQAPVVKPRVRASTKAHASSGGS